MGNARLTRATCYTLSFINMVLCIPAIMQLMATRFPSDDNTIALDSEMHKAAGDNGIESIGINIKDDDVRAGIPASRSYCKKVMVLTTWRSGSSFVGQLLKKHPYLTYITEPLQLLIYKSNIRNISAATLNSYIEKLSSCAFTDAISYTNQPYFQQKRLTPLTCEAFLNDCNECISRKRGVCVLDDFHRIEQKCKQQTSCVAMELIRIHSNHLPLVNQFLREDGHVIHLVRDPRGVISSRITIEQVTAIKERTAYIEANFAVLVGNASRHCKRIRDALETTSSWKTVVPSFQKFYHLYRYEDFAHHPEKTTRSMYSSLGMPLHNDVLTWLRELTERRTGRFNFNSTVRNLTATAEAWRYELPFSFVSAMQSLTDCQYVMRQLGYGDANSESMLLDSSLSLF